MAKKPALKPKDRKVQAKKAMIAKGKARQIAVQNQNYMVAGKAAGFLP